MSTKIRLARGGAKKNPYFRVVVADSRASRDGKFIEKIGTYSPLLSKDDPKKFQINKEKVEAWLGKGAVPSKAIARFLKLQDIGQQFAQVKVANDKRAARVELKKVEVAAAKKAAAEAEAKAKAEAEAKAKAAAEAAKAKAEEEAKAAAEAAAAKAAEESQAQATEQAKGDETPQGEANKETPAQ